MSKEKDSPRLRLRRQSELSSGQSLRYRAELQMRRLSASLFGIFSRPPMEKEWILFQFYHWVLDDERGAFRKQLQFLRRHGDFISLDDAISALQSPSDIGGRYFCVTFDDGFKNWITNAVPVLKELDVPAAFFLPTKYIGLDLDRDWGKIAPFYQSSWGRYGRFFEFLNWDECRQIAAEGFTLGSHTCSHARLTSLESGEAEEELQLSKQTIEEQVGRPCRHFCCPWGKSVRDFDPAVHPEMARRAGYVSFLTTDYGLNLPGGSAFAIKRIGTDPDLRLSMLRYTLFPSWWRSRRERLAKAEHETGHALARV